MRSKGFIAEHRGGTLYPEHHRLLVLWACTCAQHVLPLFVHPSRETLLNSLTVAVGWARGVGSVSEARRCASTCVGLARELTRTTDIAVARCVGHAVATVHMADHSLRAADYALKAVLSSGKSMDRERAWQNQQLAASIADIVVTAREK